MDISLHLVIDVGNTNIDFGFFEAEKGAHRIHKAFRMSTPKIATTDEFSVTFSNMLTFNKLEKIRIEKAIFCSVVPSINHNITKMMNLYFDLEVIEVNNNLIDSITVNYENPDDIGMDRLVNLKAASHLHGLPCLVIDYGTAVTIDALDGDGKFLGGLIMPGVHISLDALVQNTSKLPKIELDYPKHILGNSTKECMQNGLYYLNRLGVDAIVERVLREYFAPKEKNVNVVATGGLSFFLGKSSRFIEHIDTGLSLIGLKILLDEIEERKG